MKKAYVKPQVYFEDFQLSANISGGCSAISHATQGVCPYTDPELGVTIFAPNITGCTTTPPEGDNKVCYNVPDGRVVVFTS